MMEDRPRKLAPWKRMLGVLLFTAVILGSATCSYFLVQPDDPPPAEAAQEEPPVLMASFFWLVLGILFCGAGIFAYVVILVTNAFTFNFSKPFWGSLKLKLWFFNIVVLVLPAIGLGFVGRAFLGPVLIGLGLPPPLPDVVPVVGSLLLVQVALMWLNLWAPVEKSCVRRRLGGYGVAGRDSTVVGWSASRILRRAASRRWPTSRRTSACCGSAATS